MWTRALVFTIFAKSWGVRLGDNLNDMEMLTFAGRAVATENARHEIKAVADEVIGHHKDGAVFDYMEGLVDSDV